MPTRVKEKNNFWGLLGRPARILIQRLFEKIKGQGYDKSEGAVTILLPRSELKVKADRTSAVLDKAADGPHSHTAAGYFRELIGR